MLDATDAALVAALQRDGRAGFQELAAEAGISRTRPPRPRPPGPGRRRSRRRTSVTARCSRCCNATGAGPGQDWAEAVGKERWSKAWPMRTLHASGARLAFSSDRNVAEMDPTVGLYTAVTRQGLDGGPAWMPDETVDLEAAIHGYTMGSAWANFLDDRLGSITPGKQADLVLLSCDLFAVEDPREILDTFVELSTVAGEIVARAERVGATA